MANYTKTTNFTAKDALTTGDPNKKIKGSEHDTEFDNIATASVTKANKIVSGTTGNVVKQDSAGDLVDTGYQFSGLSTNIAVTDTELNILDGATVTTAELNILDGVTSTAAELNILDGVTSTFAELNILDGVTSTAAELNILDGVTSTAAELNILDGVTSTYTELNILDGVTSTAAELNILDGVTSTATELNLNDGAVLRHKVIDIGDWNMDSTTAVNVVHGLTLANIRTVSATIRRDDNAQYHDFSRYAPSGTTEQSINMDSTTVTLNRADSGVFDSTTYDSTSYNRGWITIQYVD